MNEDIRIHSWPCSYYLDSSRQWIPGRLSLTPLSLRFTADASGELLADFRLGGIDGIKKESSHLIFSSLTVLEKGTKHWFGSLRPSRNAVFNVLEHFWREQLLSGREGAAGAAPGSGKGKELTGILEGSQRRLQDTAKALHAQGEQFDNIMRGLHKIEGDMDVADRLLMELESPSWWPFSTKLWKTPADSKPKETPTPPPPHPKPEEEEEEEPLLRIPVIVTRRPDSDPKPGKLALLPSGLEIRDCDSRLLRRFSWREVDDVGVLSPYEIRVRRRFIGRADDCYGLLGARVPQLLPLLRLRLRDKIRGPDGAPGSAGGAAEAGAAGWTAASGFPGAAANPEFPAADGTDKEQLQVQKISQEEAKELRQILQKLKGLALETEAELERQDEALDSIGSSADRAALRVEHQNRRMRRLT